MEKSHQLETSAQLVTQYDEVIERHKCIIYHVNNGGMSGRYINCTLQLCAKHTPSIISPAPPPFDHQHLITPGCNFDTKSAP